MDADIVIDAHGLVKRYGARTVVDKVDLQVRRGMIYGFNHRLRGWGVTPTPFGRSGVGDLCKHHAFRAISGVKS